MDEFKVIVFVEAVRRNFSDKRTKDNCDAVDTTIDSSLVIDLNLDLNTYILLNLSRYLLSIKPGNLGILSCGLEDRGVMSLSSSKSREALGPTQLPVQWVSWLFPRGVKAEEA